MIGYESSNLKSILLIKHRFCGRVGGTSPGIWKSLNTSYDVGDVATRVRENRHRICASLGMPYERLFTVKQVHGTGVIRITSEHTPEQVALMQVDALWTTEPNCVLGIRTADCVPILLAAKNGEAIAAIHAGWRGAVGGVIEATLGDMQLAGIGPSSLVAAIGPCISKDKYEVGPEVIDAAQKILSVESSKNFDLPGFVEQILRKNGVENVEQMGMCTASNTDKFFSHRAEKGRTGRQLSVIGRM